MSTACQIVVRGAIALDHFADPTRKQNIGMKQHQKIRKQGGLLALMLGLAALGSGCAAVKANKTVGLPGLPPLASAKQVKVIERREEVTQPYQVVGQITVRRSGTMLTTGTSLDRMKQIAAEMGADGLIGLIESHGDGKILGIGSGYAWVHSCLAVKWLAPGQSTRPLALPVVVGLLPSSTTSDKPKFTRMVSESVSATLGLKGYYPLPLTSPAVIGGLDGLKNLGDVELQAVGGHDTQLLLIVSAADSKLNYAVVGDSIKAQLQVSVLDKQTRNVVLQEQSTEGNFELTGIVFGPFFVDKHRREVFCQAVNKALQKLPPIAMEVDSR
jgi:hypothetical protein